MDKISSDAVASVARPGAQGLWSRPGHRWMRIAAIVVALEYVAALAIGLAVGFPYALPIASYVIVALTIASVYGLALLLWRLARYARRGVASPIAALKADDWTPLAGFAVAVCLYGLQLAVLMWTKTMMPLVGGFWADPLLTRLDHAIFGVDPWVLTHQMPDWVSRLLDEAYVTWAPVKFATIFALLLAPASVTRARLLLTYFLLVASAAFGQYLASSAGPIFHELTGLGARFSALPLEPWAATTRDFLWEDYVRGGGKVGGGISAMPSLHVGVAAWCALALTRTVPKLGWIGWLYAATIALGSVHLGWHYATDGMVALLLLWGSWRLTTRLVREEGSTSSA